MMMGRQSNDPTVLHYSSIALLQERFRQLQRVKEMREERKLLRGFTAAAPADVADPPLQHQPKWFSHPDLVRPSRTATEEWPEFRALETSLSMGLWHNRLAAPGTIIRAENDVDTSLHL